MRFKQHRFFALAFFCFVALGLMGNTFAAEGSLVGLTWPQVVKAGYPWTLRWTPVVGCSGYVIHIGDATMYPLADATSAPWTPSVTGNVAVEFCLNEWATRFEGSENDSGYKRLIDRFWARLFD